MCASGRSRTPVTSRRAVAGPRGLSAVVLRSRATPTAQPGRGRRDFRGPRIPGPRGGQAPLHTAITAERNLPADAEPAERNQARQLVIAAEQTAALTAEAAAWARQAAANAADAVTSVQAEADHAKAKVTSLQADLADLLGALSRRETARLLALPDVPDMDDVRLADARTGYVTAAQVPAGPRAGQAQVVRLADAGGRTYGVEVPR